MRTHALQACLHTQPGKHRHDTRHKGPIKDPQNANSHGYISHICSSLHVRATTLSGQVLGVVVWGLGAGRGKG